MDTTRLRIKFLHVFHQVSTLKRRDEIKPAQLGLPAVWFIIYAVEKLSISPLERMSF